MRLPIFVMLFAMAAMAAHLPAQAALLSFDTKSAFDAAVSTTLVEDFEANDLTKNAVQHSFTHNGITYTGFAGSPSPNVIVLGPGFTNFGAGVPQPTKTTLLTANGDENFTATFATAVGAVGFDTYFNGLGPVAVRVFGTNGLLATIPLPTANQSANGIGYLGIVSTDQPITQFQWTSTSGGILNTGIDNIAAAPFNPVPEPEAYAAMLAGLCILSMLMLRSRHNRDQ